MQISEMTKDFGKYAIDKVTNFEGVVINSVLWDRGNIQYGIQPKCNNSELPEAKRFDIEFLDIKNPDIYSSEPCIQKYIPLKTDHVKYEEFKFKNGQEVESVKSKFKGYIGGKQVFLNGCKQYYVIFFKVVDGEEKSQWFEEIELKALKKETPAKNTPSSGGPTTSLMGKNV